MPVYSDSEKFYLENIRQPESIIYIDVKPNFALRWIQKRGREFEKKITLAYLYQIESKYVEWFESYADNERKVIYIDGTQDRPSEVADDVRAALRKLNFPFQKKEI